MNNFSVLVVWEASTPCSECSSCYNSPNFLGFDQFVSCCFINLKTSVSFNHEQGLNKRHTETKYLHEFNWLLTPLSVLTPPPRHTQCPQLTALQGIHQYSLICCCGFGDWMTLLWDKNLKKTVFQIAHYWFNKGLINKGSRLLAGVYHIQINFRSTFKKHWNWLLKYKCKLGKGYPRVSCVGGRKS